MTQLGRSFVALLFYAGSLFFSGCENPSNSPAPMKFSEIRQMQNPLEVHHFIDGSHFHATRRPNIYFIFFDTLRLDLALAYGGEMRSFFDRNFSFKHAYGSGTATWYSTYSLFHSSPGFLAYRFIPQSWEKEEYYGSLFLKIMDRLGYKMNSYGYDWGCVTTSELAGISWQRFLTSFFGFKSRLLERCHSDLAYDARFNGNQDEVTVAELERKLPEVITSPEGHFSMLTLFNNHDPYKWGALREGAIEEVGDHCDFSNRVTTRNRYLNSVAASDINFKRLLKLIHSLPGHKDAVIVLLSDHGEMFYEKGNETLHGGVPYQEKINTLISFQLTEDSLYHKNSDSQGVASIEDVFPTLFDYMQVTPQLPDQMVSGHSLISEPRKSVLVVQSSGVQPTRNMVLVNGQHKAWIHVDEDDFYQSSTIKLLNFTDPDDRPIPVAQHLCFNKSEAECQKVLTSEFEDALAELYPALHSSARRNPNGIVSGRKRGK